MLRLIQFQCFNCCTSLSSYRKCSFNRFMWSIYYTLSNQISSSYTRFRSCIQQALNKCFPNYRRITYLPFPLASLPFLYFIHLKNNTLVKLKSNMLDSPYQKIPPYFSKRKKYIYIHIYINQPQNTKTQNCFTLKQQFISYKHIHNLHWLKQVKGSLLAP